MNYLLCLLSYPGLTVKSFEMMDGQGKSSVPHYNWASALENLFWGFAAMQGLTLSLMNIHAKLHPLRIINI